MSTIEFIGSWYLSYAAQFGAFNLVFALATGYPGGAPGEGGVFESSSFVLLFLLFFLYAMSFVAKGFLLAAFFGKARTGGLVSCIVFLAGWFLQVNFNDPVRCWCCPSDCSSGDSSLCWLAGAGVVPATAALGAAACAAWPELLAP